MALFLDGPPSSIDDLSNQDSGLLDVCETQQINATVKLALAQEEMSIELAALFERNRSNYAAPFGQPILDLQHLVVTPAVRVWHTWQSLALVYRDAYLSQFNDRYKGKWDEYVALARWAQSKLLEVGVGLALDPLPQPSAPVLTVTPAAETGGTLYVSITYVNAAMEESTPSTAQQIAVPDGNALDIQPAGSPPNALGWNVYAGSSPASMYRQNDSPLPISADFVYAASAAVTSGALPGTGQQPNLNRALPRMLQRG